jgi:poly-D-alanine transfer protein DltD
MTADELNEFYNHLEELQGYCNFTGHSKPVYDDFELLLTEIKKAENEKTAKNDTK